MKLKILLILMLAAVTFTSYAQDGGIRGKVVSRNGRVALSNVQVKIESLGLTAMTDKDGNFIFENLPAGSYTVLFSTPDFEDLNLMVRVGDKHVQDLKSVIIVPSGQSAVLDDAVFAEFDSDSSSSDTQALPSSLSSSKDLFNNIASYRFSEMRFNVRGYDSQYSDIYLNGIRFNDAMTGYGPWSLWSGLNDATRNQENYTGLEASDFGIGGFSLGVSGSVGYSNMYREGMWRKGLFPNDSKGDSKKLDYLTYDAKLSLGYKFSGAHSIEANVAYMQQAPKFATAFVSPRTRNTTTPGLKAEKVFGADLTYNLNLPYIKARLSGYYTTIEDQSKVISFYDDTRSSFTNFAMSGIDKRYYGVELGLSVPVWNGLSVVGALSWGDYTYTSNPNFVQTVDNVDKIVLKDKVNWDGYHVESSPQLAFNIGLDYRGPRNWFAGVNFNYYDNIYLSMNPMYRTATAIKYYTNVLTSNTATNAQKASALSSIKTLRKQEKFDSAYTLSANIGKNWYIHRVYMLGFSLEVKNILNDQDIRTGGYEQMRMSKVRGEGGEQIYGRFPSKYFYLFGTTYYLNVYFRF